VAQAACIFTAGSRELLGSRVVGKTWGITFVMPLFYLEIW